MLAHCHKYNRAIVNVICLTFTMDKDLASDLDTFKNNVSLCDTTISGKKLHIYCSHQHKICTITEQCMTHKNQWMEKLVKRVIHIGCTM